MKYVLLFVLLYLLLCYILFLIVCKRFKKNIGKFIDRRMEKALLSYNEVFENGKMFVSKCEKDHLFVFAEDGIRLHGLLIKNKKSNKYLILSHGYRSTSSRDVYPSCEEYYKLGYNLLLVDHRTSNMSDGNYITFGYHEQDDLCVWIDYLKYRFKDSKIVLGGVSMGAVSSLLAASKSKHVNAVVADCPYNNAYEEVKYTMKYFFKVPSFLFIDVINFYCKIFAHFDLKRIDVSEALKNIKIPVLLIHGKCDEFIPYSNSELIYKKYKGKKKIYLFDKAQHGMSYLIDSKNYVKYIKEFLKEV